MNKLIVGHTLSVLCTLGFFGLGFGAAAIGGWYWYALLVAFHMFVSWIADIATVWMIS